jgi:hypothetical protein
MLGEQVAKSVARVIARAHHRVVKNKRMGLEGLPVTDGDVWTFDLLRRGTLSDSTGLVILWSVGLGTTGIAVWGRSWILGALAVVVVALALWWSHTKWRSRVDDLRMMQRVAEEETRERHHQ